MKPRYSNLPSSMLPFIDLLSNVIGCLCMMILVASLSQGIPDATAGDDGGASQGFERSAARKQSEANALRDAISAATQREAELNRLTNTMALQAKEQRESFDARLTYLASLGATRENYRQKIEDLERRRADFMDRLKSLREQLAQRRPSTRRRDKIEIHFAGQGRDLKPTFVECTALGVTLYTADGRETVDRHDIEGSDAIDQLIGKVGKTPQGTLILLVRPDGLNTLATLEAMADRRKVRNGKLPIPGEGELDFGPYNPSGVPVDQKEK